MRLSRVAAALCLAGLTACGTTVPLSQQSLSGDGLGDGSANGGSVVSGTTGGAGSDGTSGTGSTGVVAGTTGGSSGGGTTSSGGGAGSTGGTVVAGGSSTTGLLPVTGKKDTSPVKVAVFYVNGGNQVLTQLFPGSSVSFGDGQGEAKAVIAEINKRGGAGGHKIVPSFVPVQATGADDTGLQTACQGAVQDYHPMAIFAMFNLAEGLAKCAKKYNILLIDVALGAGDQRLYDEAKDIAFSPSQISRDLEQKLVIKAARENGKLPAGKTVGVLVQGDDPLYARVAHNAIEPTLKAYGVPYLEQTITSGGDTNGISAAILKFVTAHVDTVMFSLGNGGIPEVLFMTSADQQAYRPAYLMGDSTDTNFVGGSAPAGQIKRIFGAGTYPLANVRADQYASSAPERKCLSTLNAAMGGYTNRYSSLTGTLYCEIIGSFAWVADRVQGTLTPQSWAAAYHRIGKGYPAVTTFSTSFLPGRQDGANAYRLIGYGTACSCITYTSPIRPIPSL